MPGKFKNAVNRLIDCRKRDRQLAAMAAIDKALSNDRERKLSEKRASKRERHSVKDKDKDKDNEDTNDVDAANNDENEEADPCSTSAPLTEAYSMPMTPSKSPKRRSANRASLRRSHYGGHGSGGGAGPLQYRHSMRASGGRRSQSAKPSKHRASEQIHGTDKREQILKELERMRLDSTSDQWYPERRERVILTLAYPKDEMVKEQVGTEIFQEIFDKMPEMIKLFHKFAKLKDPKVIMRSDEFLKHVNIFMEVLDYVIDNLHQQQIAISYLHDIGTKHAKFHGIRPIHWSVFSTAIGESMASHSSKQPLTHAQLDAMEMSLESLWHKWAVMITAHIREGFERSRRKPVEVVVTAATNTPVQSYKEQSGSDQNSAIPDIDDGHGEHDDL